MLTDELLDRLQGVRVRGPGKWGALCPAHDDTHASLNVAEGRKGLLLHCHAGCSFDEIISALGVRASELYWGVFFSPTSSLEERSDDSPPRNPFTAALHRLNRRLDRQSHLLEDRLLQELKCRLVVL